MNRKYRVFDREKMKIKFIHCRIPYFAIQQLSGKGPSPDNELRRYSKNSKRKWTSSKNTMPPATRGGHTTCHLLQQNEYSLVTDARCSLSENFSYKAGRFIALLRMGRKLKEVQASNG